MFEPISEVIRRFLAENPSLEEIQGALDGDSVDPRKLPEEDRQALLRAKLERQKKAANR